MGMCSSATTVKNQLDEVCPSDEEHKKVEAQFGPYLNVDHQGNINQKYAHMMKIHKDETTGKGMRATNSYSSKISQEELQKKRAEFWETRVEANKSSWDALKFACENTETLTIVEVLTASGIKLIKKSLQMSYDDDGYRYDLPIFLINDPKEYLKEEEENDDMKLSRLKLILRIVGKDYPVESNTTDKVSTLKDHLKKMHPESASKSVRMFFAGKEMNDAKSIGKYLTEDGVITVFMR